MTHNHLVGGSNPSGPKFQNLIYLGGLERTDDQKRGVGKNFPHAFPNVVAQEVILRDPEDTLKKLLHSGRGNSPDVGGTP